MIYTTYFQQVNAITSVLENIKQERINMIQEMNSSEMNIMRAIQMTQDHLEQEGDQRDDIEQTSTPTQKENSVTTDVVQLEILKLLKETREDNKIFKKKNKNKNNPNDKNKNNNKKQKNKKQKKPNNNKRNN